MNTLDKARQIIANAEKIQARNSGIEQNYPHDDRRDYNYTSYAWAVNVLRDHAND